MLPEKAFLNLRGASSQAVYASLSYGDYLPAVCSLTKLSGQTGDIFVVGQPWMNPYRVVTRRIESDEIRADRYYAVGRQQVVGMSVAYHGTGSYPDPPQGWHRSSRRSVSQLPRSGPCFLRASRAYWLHVGVKRQDGGNIGEMQPR